MKYEEKQKQLEMALTSHKKLKLDLGDNQKLILFWDKDISNYRGYSPRLNIEVGIWDLGYLLTIASGKTKYKLEVI